VANTAPCIERAAVRLAARPRIPFPQHESGPARLFGGGVETATALLQECERVSHGPVRLELTARRE
jgi:hypothetical protein